MRIDKFLVSAGAATRSEASKAAKSGAVELNGNVVRDLSLHIDPSSACVKYFGEEIIYREHYYIMLNKPDGYISATDDPRAKTVLELLPEKLKKIGLFPCGRLDIDTLGLLILTDDGPLAHRLLSPRHHAEKTYFFRTARKIERTDELEGGVTLDDGYHTLPSKLKITGECEGYITLTEGKYHQIKRMFAAVGNHIEYLERVTFGGIELDRSLGRGDWRYLTAEEEAILKEAK